MTSIIILTTAFLAALFFKLTKTENNKLYKIALYTHLALTGLTIVTLFLILKTSFSFAGFMTDKLFVIFFLATGMLLFGLFRRNQKLLRAYFACFFLSPLLLVLGLFIPPLQFITAVAGLGLLLDGEHHRYPVDETYSIQTSRIGVLASGPTFSLVENKYLLFEKNTDILEGIGTPKSLQIEKVGADSVRLDILSSEIVNERLDTTISLKR